MFISLSNFHTHLIFLLYRNFKDILRVFYMNVNYQQKNNIACRSLFYILTTRGSQEKIVSIIIVVVPLSFFFDFFLLISQCILLLLTSKLRIAPLTHHIDLHIFFFFLAQICTFQSLSEESHLESLARTFPTMSLCTDSWISQLECILQRRKLHLQTSRLVWLQVHVVLCKVCSPQSVGPMVFDWRVA